MARLMKQRGVGVATVVLAMVLAACSGPGSHQVTMEQCAQMNRMMAQGQQMTPEQQRLRATCAHMDHQMGRQRGRP
jgi:hypothetical protein